MSILFKLKGRAKAIKAYAISNVKCRQKCMLALAHK